MMIRGEGALTLGNVVGRWQRRGKVPLPFERKTEGENPLFPFKRTMAEGALGPKWETDNNLQRGVKR